MSWTTVHRHIDKMLQEVKRRALPTWLPYLFVDPRTGADLPGYEAHNREHEAQAREMKIAPKEYGFDADAEEGIDA